MQKPADFARGDSTKDYCVHCARPDGSMRSYDEALIGMAGFMVRTQGLDEEAAKKAAKAVLDTMPAWKSRATGP